VVRTKLRLVEASRAYDRFEIVPHGFFRCLLPLAL
jgi:hypothetical protein